MGFENAYGTRLYRPSNSQCAGISGDVASATNAPNLRYQNPGQADVTRRDPSETRSPRNCSPHSDTLGSATVLLNNATRASETDSGSEPCAPSGNTGNTGNPTIASSSSTNRKKRSETDGSLRSFQKAFKSRISACVGPEAGESVGPSGSISGRGRRIKHMAVVGFGDERKT